MFDLNYYKGRKLKIQQKSQKTTQNFIASVFNFVEEQKDMQEQLMEIQAIEKEEEKEVKKKKA